MSGYYGTTTQQQLQARAEAATGFIQHTAGACQAGRSMGCDDPDRLGWDHIREFIGLDGVCGFRLIPVGQVNELRSWLREQGCRFDTWDVFLADRATASAASQAIIGRGLPEDLAELEAPREPEGEYTRRIQAVMATAGVVPFSGSLLTGALVPVTTVAIGDENRNVVAVAHAYLPHNAFSDYHRYAWGGLVAVAESQRGRGLGTYVNARVIMNAVRNLGATHVYELVSATNTPSRRMVEACGLRPEPGLVCGVATPTDAARLTR